MDDLKLIVAPSPHIRDIDTTGEVHVWSGGSSAAGYGSVYLLFGWNAVRVLLLGAAARLLQRPSFSVCVNNRSGLETGVPLLRGCLWD